MVQIHKCGCWQLHVQGAGRSQGRPAHALSLAVAQYLLGSSCAKVELATADADDIDVDDGRELFVAAWCVHPGLIPEPAQPHDLCGIRHLREHEAFHTELPTLCYLSRMRVVEVQDWAKPPSSDQDNFPGAGEDDDSGDSNYNGYHPGIDDAPPRSRSFGPQTVRFRMAEAAATDSVPERLSPTLIAPVIKM